jgi:quinolinate synthase
MNYEEKYSQSYYTRSSELLVRLSKDSDRIIRKNVATNRHTSVATLTELSQDKDALVRECVAMNPNTPKKVLETLKIDKKSIAVREAALEALNFRMLDEMGL